MAHKPSPAARAKPARSKPKVAGKRSTRKRGPAEHANEETSAPWSVKSTRKTSRAHRKGLPPARVGK
jgi:hypothetical protein